DVTDLIDMPAVGCRPRSPLITIDRPQLAIFVRPFVPDAHAVLAQVADVRFTAQKPQQLIKDRLQMQLFRGNQRKALRQVKPHLIAKNTARSGARSVAFGRPAIQNMTQQLKVLTHSAVVAAPSPANKNPCALCLSVPQSLCPISHSPTLPLSPSAAIYCS